MVKTTLDVNCIICFLGLSEWVPETAARKCRPDHKIKNVWAIMIYDKMTCWVGLHESYNYALLLCLPRSPTSSGNQTITFNKPWRARKSISTTVITIGSASQRKYAKNAHACRDTLFFIDSELKADHCQLFFQNCSFQRHAKLNTYSTFFLFFLIGVIIQTVQSS